jgi:hypothetical protein
VSDPRWLEGLSGLLSIPVGGRSGDDFELTGIESREITEAERARFGVDVLGFITFVPVNSKLRVAEITVAAAIPCPIQSYLVATHEQAHLLAEHSGWRGRVRLSEAQVEAEADLLAVAIRKRRAGGRLLDVCEACAGNYPLECKACPHPLLGDLLEGLNDLGPGGRALQEELVRTARSDEGQRFFESAGKDVMVGKRPLFKLPASRQSRTHPEFQPPADEAIDTEALVTAVGAVVAAALEGEVTEHFRDEGSGRVVRSVSRVSGRISEDTGEDTVLMQRFLDPATDKPVEGELGMWRQVEDDEAEA